MAKSDILSTADSSVESRGDDGKSFNISGRLERLPFAPWHRRCLAVLGFGHFFDAFDALAIAFVLPFLIVEWHLTPLQAGLAISAGYVGQMVGALALGAAAERYGRLLVLRLALTILSLFSIFSGLATGFGMFVVLRAIQGIGLGGEVPVGSTYMNEISPAPIRGRIVFALQTIFAMGLLATAFVAVWLIPTFGWRGMFFVGGLPLILAIFLPRLLGESPRWLVNAGRSDEADRILLKVEAEVTARGVQMASPTVSPNIATGRRGGLMDLLRGGYARRTVLVWTLAMMASLSGYGLINWMPTLYTMVYKVPLHEALSYGLASNVASVIGGFVALLIIDRIGRRWTFFIAFAGAAIPLLALAYGQSALHPREVMFLSGATIMFLSMILGGLYIYAPELYPTHIRAVGAGGASALMRLGSIIGPAVVGLLLPALGISAVFLFFVSAVVIGALVTLIFGIETRGRVLEDVSS